MKDTMSLLLAAAILSVGGLGLYMLKSQNDEDDEQVDYGLGNLWGGSDEDFNSDEDFDFADEEEYYEPKRRSHGGKTKRNKKGSGTKRRY
jgi:hypothetical protein